MRTNDVPASTIQRKSHGRRVNGNTTLAALQWHKGGECVTYFHRTLKITVDNSALKSRRTYASAAFHRSAHEMIPLIIRYVKSLQRVLRRTCLRSRASGRHDRYLTCCGPVRLQYATPRRNWSTAASVVASRRCPHGRTYPATKRSQRQTRDGMQRQTSLLKRPHFDTIPEERYGKNEETTPEERSEIGPKCRSSEVAEGEEGQMRRDQQIRPCCERGIRAFKQGIETRRQLPTTSPSEELTKQTK